MSILSEFLPSIIGGLLIGMAAVLFMATSGRIAGISGIVARLMPPDRGKTQFDTGIAFLIGLVVAGPLYQLFSARNVVIEISTSQWMLALAGLLVGIGTNIGSGCTSGHGVCGISRLSQRSIAATATFMVTAIVTVYCIRHLAG